MTAKKPTLRFVAILAVLLALLSGCSADSVEINDGNAAGITGNNPNADLSTSPGTSTSTSPGANASNSLVNTALLLSGTVNEIALASTNTVEVKSADGQRSNITYNANGEYSVDQLPGAGPWLLRVQLNQGRALYGIAYADGTRNINTFSDISLRRWFSMESLDVDEQFESNAPIQNLPSAIEYDTSVTSVFVLIELVAASYEVSGNDVISTPYETNSQGLHAFLQGNSVVLEDGLVSFQLTDPETNIQSETATTIEIASNLMETGAPPSMPGSVRAIGSDDDNIRLVWEPSVDDVAVVGYVVLRDETLLGTTPYPQFIDQNVATDASARYVIVAIDGAGNSSSPSLPILGSLNPVVDNTPPQAPTQLAFLSASESVIRLEWIPPSAPDVVSFELFRSTATSAPSRIQNVAIARATDTNIRNDEIYCYQVRAIDGSGNASAFSNEVCSTLNETVAVDNSVTSPNPAPNPLPGAMDAVGEWNIVDADIDALNCSSTLTQDQITVGRIELTSGCYVVPEDLVIARGATLRIGQGVVLKFARETRLTVEGGTLTALGTLDNPVVFTGVESATGFWGGIEFQSNSVGNTLDGVVVQYAGSGSARAAVSTRRDGARFRMQNTLVRRNDGAAISFNSFGIRIEAFNGNRITENEKVGDVIATEIHSLIGNIEYIDNTLNRMDITRRVFLEADVNIPNLGIPISWSGIVINRGSLTIQPGVELEMIPTSLIEVNGELNIVGTADQPITIRNRVFSTLNWNGILLSGPGDKNINHAFIIAAGESRENTGAIEIDCTQNIPFTVSVNNTEIIDSASWGIFAQGSGCTYDIGANVTFTNTALGDVSVP